jgi:hypothetical protein
VAARWNGITCVPTPAGPVSSDRPPELTTIDNAIRGTFLAKAYAGPTEQILAQYQRDAVEVQKLDTALQQFASACPSRDWTAAAIAQQGTLFDSLATKLDDSTKNLPQSSYFTAGHRALLRQLQSRPDDLQAQADELRKIVREKWRSKSEIEISAAVELAVRRYVTAVDIARRYGLKGVDVDHALSRLAEYTRKLGDEKMREYVTKANVPYRPGMYLPSPTGL